MSSPAPNSAETETSSQQPWFVRRGFCFTVAPCVEDGVLTLHLEFQNCYSHPADAFVMFHLPGTPLRFSHHFVADGGERGLQKIRCAVPERFQGQTEQFNVYADVEFPQEPGELQQTMEANPVNATPGVGLEIFRNIFGALFGRVSLRRETTLVLKIPNQVATTVGGGSSPQEALAHPILQYTLLAALIGVMVFGLLMILFPGIFG